MMLLMTMIVVVGGLDVKYNKMLQQFQVMVIVAVVVNYYLIQTIVINISTHVKNRLINPLHLVIFPSLDVMDLIEELLLYCHYWLMMVGLMVG